MSALGSFLKGTGVSLSNQYETDLRLEMMSQEDPDAAIAKRRLKMVEEAIEELLADGNSAKARSKALQLASAERNRELTEVGRTNRALSRERKRIQKDAKRDKRDLKSSGATSAEKLLTEQQNETRKINTYRERFEEAVIKILEGPDHAKGKDTPREGWYSLLNQAYGDAKTTYNSILKKAHIAATGVADFEQTQDIYKISKAFNTKEMFDENYGYLLLSVKDPAVKPIDNNSDKVIKKAEAEIKEKFNDGTLAPDTTEQEITDAAEAELGSLPGESVATIDTLGLAKKYENWLTGGELTPEKKQELLDDLRTRQTKLEEDISIGEQEPDLQEFRAQRPYGRFTFKTVRRSGGLEIPQSLRDAYESAQAPELQDLAASAKEPKAPPTERQQENAARVNNLADGIVVPDGLDLNDFGQLVEAGFSKIPEEARRRSLAASELPGRLGQTGIDFSSLGGRDRFGELDTTGSFDRPDLGFGVMEAEVSRELDRPVKRQISEEDLQLIEDTSPENLSRALFGKASPFAKKERDTLFDGPKSAEELGLSLKPSRPFSDDDFFAQQMTVPQELSQPGNAFEGEEDLDFVFPEQADYMDGEYYADKDRERLSLKSNLEMVPPSVLKSLTGGRPLDELTNDEMKMVNVKLKKAMEERSKGFGAESSDQIRGVR